MRMDGGSVYNDDTVVETGLHALIANEEDKKQRSCAGGTRRTTAWTVLFGHRRTRPRSDGI